MYVIGRPHSLHAPCNAKASNYGNDWLDMGDPLMPKKISRLGRRMTWSTITNAKAEDRESDVCFVYSRVNVWEKRLRLSCNRVIRTKARLPGGEKTQQLKVRLKLLWNQTLKSLLEQCFPTFSQPPHTFWNSSPDGTLHLWHLIYRHDLHMMCNYIYNTHFYIHTYSI